MPSSLDHLLLSAAHETDIISIQPASPPSCRFSQRSPQGISGEPLPTWDLLVPLTPVSLRLTPATLWITLRCLQVWMCRRAQTLTGRYQQPVFNKPSENKGNLPENELKASTVRSYLFEQVWSLSRSAWLLIVEHFSWETHLMELKKFSRIDLEKATAVTVVKSHAANNRMEICASRNQCPSLCTVLYMMLKSLLASCHVNNDYVCLEFLWGP